MKSESTKTDIKLRPEAPAFVPASKKIVNHNSTQSDDEPQCSRYSRKSVRRIDDNPNSPRPILGTNNSRPRPILGRKDNAMFDEEENEENYMGREFRSIYRRIQRMKISEENKKQKKKTKN